MESRPSPSSLRLCLVTLLFPLSKLLLFQLKRSVFSYFLTFAHAIPHLNPNPLSHTPLHLRPTLSSHLFNEALPSVPIPNNIPHELHSSSICPFTPAPATYVQPLPSVTSRVVPICYNFKLNLCKTKTGIL